MSSKRNKALLFTTAIVGAALLPAAARATNYNIGGTTAPIALQNGDTLTVTGTGKISGGAIAVSAFNTTPVSVNNSGLVKGGTTGISVTSHGNISGGITNQIGAAISGGVVGLLIGKTGNVSGGVDNLGTISGGSQGIDIGSKSVFTGNISNGQASAGAFIQGGQDGIVVTGTSTISGTITNVHGTISGNNAGISIISHSHISGAITNDAGNSISGGGANADGIHVGQTSTLSGGIANHGQIQGTHAGIFVTTNSMVSLAVDNFSGGIIHGNVAGISVGTGANISGGISNSAGGSISGNSYGIAIIKGQVSGTGGGVSNSGLIRGAKDGIAVSTGNISPGISNLSGGTISGATFGVGVKNSAMTGGVNNAGLIKGGSAGLALQSSSLAGGITNSGTIQGLKEGIGLLTATISKGIQNKAGGVISGSSYGIGARAGTISSLSNSGTIEGIISGVALNLGSNISGGIANNLGGTISGGATGIAVDNISKISGGIADAGVISGGTHGIKNAGVIGGTAAATGIAVTGSKGAIKGGIANSGTISGTATGIKVGAGAKIVGGVLDTGLIAGGTAGINNAGTISFGTTALAGITVKGGDIKGTLVNTGKIVGASAGIMIKSSTMTAQISNAGTISSGQFGINVRNTSDIKGGVSNSGLILGNSFGLLLLSHSNASGGVTNKAGGTISGGATAVNIDIHSNVAGGISNSGLIRGGTSEGILVTGTSDISGGVVNHAGGVIRGATGIDVAGSNISGGLSNAGTISGVGKGLWLPGGNIGGGGLNNGGLIRGKTGILVSSGSVSGHITNSGTIEGTGGTAIGLNNLAGAAPIDILGGAIVGNVTDSNPAAGFSPVTIGGNFTTSGNFTVSSVTVNAGNSLTISPGNTVTMNTMPASAGGYNFGIASVASFGNIVVSSGAVHLVPSLVTVDVTGALAPNSQIEVAGGSVAETGFAQGMATPVRGSALYMIDIVDGSNALIAGGSADNVYLVVTGKNPGAVSGGNGGVFNVLQGLAGTTNPQLAQAITNVNGASSTGALNNTLSSVQPATDRGVFETSYQLLDTLLSLTDGRLNSAGASATGTGGGPRTATADEPETGMAAGNAGGGRSLWGQFFGQAAHQMAGGGLTGFSANTAGFAMGADTDRIVQHGVFGVAISYGNSYISSKNAEQNQTTVDSYQVSLYGDYDLGGHNFLRGMAAYALDSDGNSRHNVGGVPGLTAKGSYDADEYSTELKAGHHFTLGDTEVTPSLMARYLGYDGGSYTESGAGGADLHVSQKFLNLLEVGPTIEAAWSFRYPDGSRLMPAIHAGYRYDLIGDAIDTTSSFTGGGAAFQTLGARPNRNRFDLGADASLFTAGAWEFKASYDLDLRQDYFSNNAVLRATYRF